MIDVSIIVVNYNTCKITKNCIDSIFEYTKDINFEVILVDNNSKDESYSIFSNDNRIIYLYQETNWGFGKANNIGYKYAKGKYLFLLNSDTLLRSNAIKEFFLFMEKSKDNIACVGTMLKSCNNKYLTSYNSFPTFWTGFDWFTILGPILRKVKILKNDSIRVISKIQEVDFVSGADLFMKKNIADIYGLFDQDFFMYFEETEMQYRYRNKGYKNYIYPTPKIIHLEEYSTNNLYSKNYFRKRVLLLQGFYMYLKKTKGIFIYYIFRILYGFMCLFWLIYPKYNFSDKLYFIKYAYK